MAGSWARHALLLFILVALGSVSAEAVQGQIFQGRVLDERTEAPVATALVRLVDESGEARAITIADSAGAYALRAPTPGVYRLEAERIGFTDLETPLLRADRPEGTYPLDLLMAPAPVELQGFTIETNRVSDERVDQNIRHLVGLSPRSMRYEPIRFDAIQSHIEMGRVLEDLVRWEAKSGLFIRHTREGTCYEMRKGCVPVALNGVPLNQMFTGDIPLDMVYTIVIVSPGDGSIVYPGGAILLYTEGWVR